MERHQADLVIIGCGAAAFSAALVAQKKLKRIILLCKGGFPFSGSTFRNLNSCWGITFAQDDREREVLLNTVNTVAKGTNHPPLSSILVEESYQAFLRLLDWGVHFRCSPQGAGIARVSPCFSPMPLAAVIEDTRQCARILVRNLDRAVVEVFSHTIAERIELAAGAVRKVHARSRRGEVERLIDCKAVLLATGGHGASFSRHIVDPDLTGDGYHLAASLGLPLHNMEFQQRVWEDIDLGGPRFSLRYFFDEGYLLKTAQGRPIDIPPRVASLATARQGHVPISNLQEDRLFDQFFIDQMAGELGHLLVLPIENNKAAFKVAPHVQVSNGGVLISPWGETGVPGLFAAGEVTTGMHGGDRVGGMMIANCLVFGKRAGEQAVRYCSAA